MHRRSMLWGAVSAVGAAFAASRAEAATETPAKRKLKVVYHLNDLDKVNFVLGNIQNHFDGVGGPDNVTIALVIHGQALRAFHAASANPDITRRVGQFSKAGVELAVCGNTMKSQKVTCRICCRVLSPSNKAAWCASRNCSRRDISICGPERSIACHKIAL